MPRDAGHVLGLSITVSLQKRVDLVRAFVLEDRARGVHHAPASFQQGPQRVEQPGLDLGQTRDVVGTTQPARIRVTAHDA